MKNLEKKTSIFFCLGASTWRDEISLIKVAYFMLFFLNLKSFFIHLFFWVASSLSTLCGVWPFMLRQSLVWVQTTEFKYKSVGSTLTCNDVNDDSCRVIRNGVPLFRHQRSNNIRTDNLHENVKLECVKEKY